MAGKPVHLSSIAKDGIKREIKKDEAAIRSEFNKYKSKTKIILKRISNFDRS